LALLGLAVQAIALWRAPHIPRWATATIILGCALFLAFWDIDNLMIVGEICLIAGLLRSVGSFGVTHRVTQV